VISRGIWTAKEADEFEKCKVLRLKRACVVVVEVRREEKRKWEY
jgi:hypothetical protein